MRGPPPTRSRIGRALVLPAFVALTLVAACGEPAEPAAVADAGPGDAPTVSDLGAPPADVGAAEPDVAALPDPGPAEVVEPDAKPDGCPADECDIDGECWENEAPNPDNPCLRCVVLAADDEWTPDDSVDCDDGDACTPIDGCLGGVCAGFDPVVCNDDNPCTDEACDPLSGACVATPNSAPCDDGDVCLLGSVCADGACQKGTAPLSCDDGNACTVDSCHAAEGCSSAPIADGGACDDGDECSVEDTCQAGACVGAARDCDDDDVCTVDGCVTGLACVYVSLAGLCEDGNPCTAVACDAESGCVYTFTTAACDDDNACTGADTCSLGACFGVLLAPNDSNPCTDDSCHAAIGGIYIPNTNPCDDENECTLGDTCVDGGCGPGAEPLDCDDGDPCSSDLCEAGSGCYYELNSAPCTDGSVCTQLDTCVQGDCVGADPMVCDDGNDCTLDACDPELGCVAALVAHADCRPEITVDYPPRAATILGKPAEQVVIVTGSVESGAGPVESLTINGASVDLVDGAFSKLVYPHVGGNTLVLVATDSFGSVRKRAQSFLWSTAYHKPELDVPKSGMVDPGLGIWLSNAVLGQLAQSLGGLVDVLSVGDSIDNPVYSGGDYEVHVKNLTHNPPQLALASRPGGLKLTVSVTQIKADIDAPGECEECVFGVCVDLCPDFDGDLKINSIVATANVDLWVEDHQLKANVAAVSVSISGADVDIDGVIGFIVGPLVDNLVDDLTKDLEQTIGGSMADALEPALEAGLGALAFESSFDMPSFDPAGGSVPVDMKTDFSSVTFDAAGGVIRLRTGAYSPKVTPHDKLGALARVGCNLGPQILVVPKASPFELVLSDDMINELLYAAWNGGLLEFDVPPEMLAGAEMADYGITDLAVSLSGMSAPTLSDCKGGVLDVHIGDMRVIADLVLLGTELTLEMYITFTAGFEFTLLEGELGLGFTEIKSLESEITVLQDDLIGSEVLATEMVNGSLVPALLEGLDGGALGGIPLPAMEFGDGAALTIVPNTVERMSGNTVVGGDLK